MLSQAKCVDLPAHHVVFYSSALGVLLCLQAQQVVLQFVVRSLHFKLVVLGNAGLQHRSKLVGRSVEDLLGRWGHEIRAQVAVADVLKNGGWRGKERGLL